MERPPERQIDLRARSSVFIDQLTNLPNRYFLFNVFSKYVLEAQKKGTGLAVFMLDIDNFKHVNDTYGHLRGDDVIQQVGSLLRESVRGDDTVIRYAGDEFIILSRFSEESQLRFISSRVIERFSTNVFKVKAGEQALRLSVSGGFAIYQRDSEKLEDLLNFADKALYYSKERGKNRFSDFKEVALGTVTYKETLKALSFPRFVNRIPQMQTLKNIWNNVLSSRFSFCLVKGKAGIGKTRLLDEFQDFLSHQRIITLKAICTQQHTFQPYYSLAKVLNDFIEAHPDKFDINSILSDKEASALSGLIPQLKAENEPETVMDKQDLRINIFKGLRALLINFSKSEGLFLYFDNAHWLDKATLELLNYFLTTEKGHKIMCAVAFGEDELSEKELPIKEFFILQKNAIVTIDVVPLTLNETRDFIEQIFVNIKASDKFFESVYQFTKGNCLFIKELLKCLAEDGKILYQDNQWQILSEGELDIPASLEEVIQRRLRKIDPETKEILAAAAVMGGPFQLEVMRKLFKKNQGELFEIIDQARENGIFRYEDKQGEVNFMSEFLQKAIYNGMVAEQKTDLHRKTEELMSLIYKDNMRSVLGELMYHSQQMGDTSKIDEYRKSIAAYAIALFQPEELSTYIEELGKDIEAEELREEPQQAQIEQIDTEIPQDILTRILMLIRAILTSIKNISLYPEQNKMRRDSISIIYEQIKDMLTKTESLTFNELNRILFVNSRRMPYKQEKEEVVSAFIELMKQKDIQAIQFLSGITEKEVNDFLTTLALDPDELRRQAGIASILSQRGVLHIKFEKMDFASLAGVKKVKTAKIRERLTSAMLLNFILSTSKGEKANPNIFVNQLKSVPAELAKNLVGAAHSFVDQGGKKEGETKHTQEAKLIAEGIEEIAAKLLPGGWQAHREDLAKLFSSLDKSVQCDLLSLASSPDKKGIETFQDVVTSFTEQEIVDMISSGYTKSKDSLIYMKDLYNKLTNFKPEEKEKIIPVLEDKLKTIGLDDTEISFVTKKGYEDMGIQEKVKMLFELPTQLYASLGEENIKTIIKELVSVNFIDELRKVIEHFIEGFKKSEAGDREILYRLFGGIIDEVPYYEHRLDDVMFELFSALENSIKEETTAYQIMLEDVKKAIKWISAAFILSASLKRELKYRRLMSLRNLINALFEKSKAAADSDEKKQQKAMIDRFITLTGESELLDVLIEQLKDVSLYSLAEEIIIYFGYFGVEKLVKAILTNTDLSFEGYLYRKKISRVLRKIGPPALEIIKKLISSENDIGRMKFLFDLIESIDKESLLESLESLIKHPNTQIRKEVVIALGRIGNDKSKKLISQMCKDLDSEVSFLAKSKLAKF